MRIADFLIAEFDQEMPKTRMSLERVPADKFSFQPHEKSMTMAGLATHLANVPSWAVFTLNDKSYDLAPPGQEPEHMTEITRVQEALDHFDLNVREAREALSRSKNEDLNAEWTLLHGGHPLFTMPRLMVYRSMVINHMIHHRAQLGVYLRMTGVAVPSLYGPSADER